MMTRTVKLPLNYEVEFSWDGKLDRMNAVWTPCEPKPISSPRHFRKFWGAYDEARNGFLQDMANSLNKPMIIADQTGFTTIKPQARH